MTNYNYTPPPPPAVTTKLITNAPLRLLYRDLDPCADLFAEILHVFDVELVQGLDMVAGEGDGDEEDVPSAPLH